VEGQWLGNQTHWAGIGGRDLMRMWTSAAGLPPATQGAGTFEVSGYRHSRPDRLVVTDRSGAISTSTTFGTGRARGESLSDLQLCLPRPGALELGLSRAPVRPWSVQLQLREPWKGEGAGIRPELRRGMAVSRDLTIGDWGTLGFEALAPGTYDLTFHLPDRKHAVHTLRGLEIAPGDRLVDPRLAAVDLREILPVVVLNLVDAGGRPLEEDARGWAGWLDDAGQVVWCPLEGATGILELEELPQEVVVAVEGRAQARLELDAFEATCHLAPAFDLEVVLPEGVSMPAGWRLGMVLGPPAGDVGLTLGLAPFGETVESDADGSFRLTSSAAVHHAIELFALHPTCGIGAGGVVSLDRGLAFERGVERVSLDVDQALVDRLCRIP